MSKGAAGSALKLCYKRFGGDTEAANILSIGSTGTIGSRPRENFLNGDIAEVLIYNSALSAADRRAVENYLAAKWAQGNFGGALPGTTDLSIAAGATVDLNGAAQTIASLGDSGGGGGSVINSSARAATLTLDGTGTSRFSGTLGGGVGHGPLNLATAGGGAFSQTFHGAVTVNTLTARNASATLTFNHASTTVATADLSAGAGTVSAATHPLTVTSALRVVSSDVIPKAVVATVSGAAGFRARGANLADRNSDRTLTLAGGTLTLAASEAPAIVADSSALWLDASRASTVTKDGANKVSTWASRSRGLHAGAHAVARYVNGFNYTAGNDVLYNATGGPSGLPAIQTSNANYLNFRTGGGAPLTLYDIRSVFWVVRGAGWVLGDNEATQPGGVPTYGHFHRGGNPGYGANATDPILIGGAVASSMNWRMGTSSMAAITPTSTALGAAWSIVDAIQPGGNSAYLVGGSLVLGNYQATRTGNQNICEVIVFNTTLSGADRDVVEAYLKKKWIDGHGDPNVVNLAKTHIAATASSTLDLGAATADHTLGGLSPGPGATLSVQNANRLTLSKLSPGILGGSAGRVSMTGTLDVGGTVAVVLSGQADLPTYLIATAGSFLNVPAVAADDRGGRWRVRQDGGNLYLDRLSLPGSVLVVR